MRRMFARDITEQAVEEVLYGGKVIQSYADDKPYPGHLILGWVDQRPIHVVAADDSTHETWIIITVYEPTGPYWDESFERRVKR